MPRGRQVIRQWKLLRALEVSRRGLTAEELHEAAGEDCALRTIYRDLDHLAAAGFPIYKDESRWRVLGPGEGGWTIPVDPTEVLALSLSDELLAPLRGSYLEEPFAELRAKILAMMTPEGRRYWEELRKTAVATLFGAGRYADQGDELEAIREAITKQQRLAIEYAKPRRDPERRVVEPYCTWYASGRVYLVAYCHKAEDVRTFALQRIQNAQVLDEAFDLASDFDPAAFSRLGFGVYHGPVHRVVIDFAPEVAHLIREHRYHHSQRVEELSGGGVRLRMTAAGLPEMAAWVAGFGGRAVAREPEELVAAVRRLHEAGLRALEGE